MRRTQFSKRQMSLFVLGFALIGGYFLIRSIAAPNPNLPGDLNGDCQVDGSDLSILLSDYGTSNAAADINGDGTVNASDLSTLESNYGKTGTCPANFTTNLTNGMTITPPFTWTFNPGVATTAGYFWDGSTLLQKISGPGPYTFTIQPDALSSGVHNLGHGWDLASDGSHHTPPSSYSVTINNPSGGGGGGGGGMTFESVSGFARPAPATPSAASSAGWRLVPFSTKTGLDSAIANMQPHDYIYYNGSGVLTISSSTGNAYSLHDLTPSSPVVLDFGAARDVWDPSMVTNNYVKFAYTGTGQYEAMYMYNLSNIRIFGGEYNTGQYGNTGMRLFGPDSNLYIMDAYTSMTGGSGLAVQATTHSGSSSTINNFTIRAEYNRFCMNPAHDPHADKGTGCHGAILHGSSGTLSNGTFVVYAHDPLRPGETSAGKTWPEGAGGSAVEPGASAGANINLTYYIKGVNLLMIPNGTNPGSTGSQTGGNVVDAWGSIPFQNVDFKWIEGDNTTGAVFHGTGGGWYQSPASILVEHGRHNNTNQQPNLGSIGTNPYQTGYGITYQDIK